MYRNLASLGISTAAFAHETEAVGLDLELHLADLKNLQQLPAELRCSVDAPSRKSNGCSETRSMQLVNLFLEFVRQRNQQEGSVGLPDLLKKLLKRYEPFLERVGVRTILNAKGEVPNFYRKPIDMEAGVYQLLINYAVWAMRGKPKREIHFDYRGRAKRSR